MQEISKRKFGIEMEVGFKSEENNHSFRRGLMIGWNAVRDGSISCANPIEVVSPPMSGDNGIKQLKKVCESLEKYGAFGDHPSCGMHTHLDASEFIGETTYEVIKINEYNKFLEQNKKTIVSTFLLDNRLVSAIVGNRFTDGYRVAAKWLEGQVPGGQRLVNVCSLAPGKICVTETMSKPGVARSFLVDEKAYKMLRDTSRTRISEALGRNLPDAEIHALEQLYDQQLVALNPNRIGRYVVAVRTDVVEKLKTVMLFYVSFDQVFQNMVQDSRKIGNMYCQNISDSFTIEDIMKVNTVDDFEKMWFKTDSSSTVRSSKGNRYDDSRYHNVNFHSLWRHGTIEIRSHSGTIDWRRIMLWTQLHQIVIDACAEGKISQEQILRAEKLDLRDKTLYMIELLELPLRLDKYVRRMVNHFAVLKNPL
jgi:hypothetical protein